MNMKRVALLVGIAAGTLVGYTPILATVDTDDGLAQRVQRVIVRYVHFTVFDDVDVDVARDGGIGNCIDDLSPTKCMTSIFTT